MDLVINYVRVTRHKKKKEKTSFRWKRSGSVSPGETEAILK